MGWPIPNEKEAFSGKEADYWEGSCSLGRELPSGKEACNVGTKIAVFKKSVDLKLVKGFGEYYCREHKAMNTEKFLLQILGQREYRVQQYFDGQKDLDLNKIISCSSTILLHIKRAHLQTKLLDKCT